MVRIYTRGGPGLDIGAGDLGWTVVGPGMVPNSGIVTDAPEWQCVQVRPGWRLTVSDLTAVAGEQVVGAAWDTGLPGEETVDIAINAGAGGAVRITSGIPPWWPAKPPNCDATP